jgi:hypothetical protein
VYVHSDRIKNRRLGQKPPLYVSIASCSRRIHFIMSSRARLLSLRQDLCDF